jgi:hypothetical protein
MGRVDEELAQDQPAVPQQSDDQCVATWHFPDIVAYARVGSTSERQSSDPDEFCNIDLFDRRALKRCFLDWAEANLDSMFAPRHGGSRFDYDRYPSLEHIFYVQPDSFRNGSARDDSEKI